MLGGGSRRNSTRERRITLTGISRLGYLRWGAMDDRGRNHTAVSFILPSTQSPLRQRHAALFEELEKPGFDVAEVSVEPGVRTMEQALFVLANEMDEPDVIVLVDERSSLYDYVELSTRCLA